MAIEHQYFGKRPAAATLFVFVVLSLLIVRLYYLQGIYGTYFRDLSENNRIRTVRTAPPRGTIYDREGRLLVGNRPAFNISIITEDVPNLEKTLLDIAEISGRNLEQLKKQFAVQRGRHRFEPKIVIADASREEVARVKANTYRLPGVIVDVVPTRFYPGGDLAAQVFGYSREISKEQLETMADYRRGDVIGQTGLEKSFESELRGKAGLRQVEVDARGNRRGELGIIQDLPGKDLIITIDQDVQRAAQDAFAGRKGALAALDPNSGEVIALVSSPSFDANLLSGSVNLEDWQKIVTDKTLPLRLRPIDSTYPVGSTFKVITTVAGLAEKKITTDTVLECPGYYMFAGRPWRCHKKSGHGPLSVKRALGVSCNAFYFALGNMLGIELIEKYARGLGLGVPTGIELPGEVGGIVPSDEWKRKRYGVRWFPGDTLPVAIGQGYVVATPLQMAVMMATVANGGTVYRPQIVRKVIDRLENREIEFPPTVIRQAVAESRIFELTRELAAGVVNEPGSTGRAAKFDEFRVGGKTGTAQVAGLGKERLAEHLNDHAWFVAFAPVESPQIALAIIVENGGHGGATAAPISHKVMEVFFRKRGLLKDPAAPPEPPAEETTEGVGEEGQE